MGHGPHSSNIFVLFYDFLFCVVLRIVCVCVCVCKRVLYYCHRVATQLQLTNISYHPTLHQYLYVTKTLQSLIWLRNLQPLCSSNVHQLGPILT